MPAGATAPTRSLLLASASARRRLLLGLLELPYRWAATDLDESPLPAETPNVTVRRLAGEKALAARPAAGEWVLAADTMVIMEGRSFGKPADDAEARETLRALSGRQHAVVTAVALLAPGSRQPGVGECRTCVRVRALDDGEIADSIARGTPRDKAGGYAIQDEELRPVADFLGCYLNVVGLPLCDVVRQLRAAGWPLPAAPANEALRPPCALCLRGAQLPDIGGEWLLGDAPARP
jgi:septum formation protein